MKRHEVFKLDVHTPETRSFNMSRIRSADTKPEVLLRKLLFARGFRFRINDRRYPGRPDILLPQYKTAIFVNGCFWHGHENCKHFVWPEANAAFWKNKILQTIERDAKVKQQLEGIGWFVLVVWECQLRKDVIEDMVRSIETQIRNNRRE